MGYPVLADWIRFKRISEDKYLIIDLLNDETIETDAATVRFASQLDGKRSPYEIGRQMQGIDVGLLLDELETERVIRDKRFLFKHFLYLLVTVWRPRVTTGLRLFAFFVNGVLLVSWLPLLLFSVYYAVNNLYDLSSDYIVLGTVVGLAVGIAMHELGHMFACLAYGGRVFEVGVMLQFLLPGAYVLLNSSAVKKRMRRIQISAAGVEMNFVLTAVFLLLTVSFADLSGFFLGAAIQNAFLGFINLTFINGFDGMAIMSELLGTDELIDKAKSVIKNKRKRNRLLNDGVSGQATVAVCYALKVIQVALPLIFVLNIAGVITCFI
ncbi:MAG: hypothetical protein IJE14_00915 [Clostridia bacterium]|nr:hypothetical protein [Clostridia bacterium]